MQVQSLIQTEIILYVRDQDLSTEFYSIILSRQPSLHVPGMTEFILSDTCKLGLMPNDGIAKIIHPNLPHPETATGIPRCEIYWLVDDINAACALALTAKAKLVSPAALRDWGHRVVYFSDPDGHVIAFAEVVKQ
ncbi:MAG: lactoylglutathione lyase [Bacteroidetes bacterium]|jgi:catechol 2,3-dioxygenase-like lactoylglutathione lyase family enzyme|nr:lactoylglutathione lyase [Bacteroidota bacterium]MBK9320087.1 lactoylglutathione lyase [Bacteroidota bacterium]MBK9402099.1 lactoylglutathione lyase [Bacteroidota bacterium]